MAQLRPERSFQTASAISRYSLTHSAQPDDPSAAEAKRCKHREPIAETWSIILDRAAQDRPHCRESVLAISRLHIIMPRPSARIFSHPIAAGIAILAVAAAIHVSVLRWYLLLMIQGQSVPLRRAVDHHVHELLHRQFHARHGRHRCAAALLYRAREAGQRRPGLPFDCRRSAAGNGRIAPARCDPVRRQLFGDRASPGNAGSRRVQRGRLRRYRSPRGAYARLRPFVPPLFSRLRVVHRLATHLSLLVQIYRRSLPLLGLCLLISVGIHVLMLGSLVILASALFGDTLSVSQLGCPASWPPWRIRFRSRPAGLHWAKGHSPTLCHLMDPANVTRDYGSVIFLQTIGRPGRDAPRSIFVSGVPSSRDRRAATEVRRARRSNTECAET